MTKMEVHTHEDGSGTARYASGLVRQPGWRAGKVEKGAVLILEERRLRTQESL